jgi:hypothetical protein
MGFFHTPMTRALYGVEGKHSVENSQVLLAFRASGEIRAAGAAVSSSGCL